eukprot:scaffold47304_cov75-Phaeocystis_antarctica.AAC.2
MRGLPCNKVQINGGWLTCVLPEGIESKWSDCNTFESPFENSLQFVPPALASFHPRHRAARVQVNRYASALPTDAPQRPQGKVAKPHVHPVACFTLYIHLKLFKPVYTTPLPLHLLSLCGARQDDVPHELLEQRLAEALVRPRPRELHLAAALLHAARFRDAEPPNST